MAAGLQMGKTKSDRSMLHRWMHYSEKSSCTQLHFQSMADAFSIFAATRANRRINHGKASR
jgi:hypothetical protein